MLKEMRKDRGFGGSHIPVRNLNLTVKRTSKSPLGYNADLSKLNNAVISVLLYVHSYIKQ